MCSSDSLGEHFPINAVSGHKAHSSVEFRQHRLHICTVEVSYCDHSSLWISVQLVTNSAVLSRSFLWFSVIYSITHFVDE